jgi:hypothetical protein
MRAVGACSMDFFANLDKQDLAAFYTLNFNLLLLAILEIERANALQLEFGNHSSVIDAEARRLSIERFAWKVDAERGARQTC